MLTYLKVHNLALIDHLEIDFHEGFSALTGETGAGKSLLIESISFVLGERSNKELIRNGESKAYVEACFALKRNNTAAEYLKANELYDSEEVIVYRDLNITGKSTARINGTLVSINDIKVLGDKLIDLHGQHAHQSLLNEDTHIHLLDSFCDNCDSMEQMQKAREKTMLLQKEIKTTEANLSIRARRLQEINVELQEITNANLYEDEEEELTDQRNKARYSALIEEKLSQAYEMLHGESGAITKASAASNELSALSKVSNEYSEYASQIDSAFYVLEDISNSVRDALNSLAFNTRSLDEIESRLFLIDNLKHKYGSTITEILQFKNQLLQEKELLENADISLDELKKNEAEAFNAYKEAAYRISESRKKTAYLLEKNVTSHLKKMGMPSACFSVRFDSIAPELLNEMGCDNVSFLFSANKGSPMKSLAKTASGGEISRVMLSIKAVLSNIDGIDTLVFDEIDTGISGMIAHTVAQEMRELSLTHQIICVTHLPQIAAAADHHYCIYKTESNDSTNSKIVKLKEEDRPKELARIMGSDQSITGLEHAKELLREAKMGK